MASRRMHTKNGFIAAANERFPRSRWYTKSLRSGVAIPRLLALGVVGEIGESTDRYLIGVTIQWYGDKVSTFRGEVLCQGREVVDVLFPRLHSAYRALVGAQVGHLLKAVFFRAGYYHVEDWDALPTGESFGIEEAGEWGIRLIEPSVVAESSVDSCSQAV